MGSANFASFQVLGDTSDGHPLRGGVPSFAPLRRRLASLDLTIYPLQTFTSLVAPPLIVFTYPTPHLLLSTSTPRRPDAAVAGTSDGHASGVVKSICTSKSSRVFPCLLRQAHSGPTVSWGDLGGLVPLCSHLPCHEHGFLYSTSRNPILLGPRFRELVRNPMPCTYLR